MFSLILKGQFKTLFSALIAPVIVFVGNVFKFSQRKSFEYGAALMSDIGNPAHPLFGSEQVDGTPITLVQLFTNYGSFAVENKIQEPSPFVFPSGDGTYRVRFASGKNEALATIFGSLMQGAYFNVTVLNGVPVEGELEKLSHGQELYVEERAVSAANLAKYDAVNIAAADASTKADAAQNAAIGSSVTYTNVRTNFAISEAATLANAARTMAVNTAATDATTKANTAVTDATLASKGYTDAEIAKIKILGELGLTYRLHDAPVVDDKAATLVLPVVPTTSPAMDMSDKKFYVIEVTGRDSANKVIGDKEMELTVITGYAANNTAQTAVISVTSGDHLMYQVLDINGTKRTIFIKIYNNALKEVMLQLEGMITTQAQELYNALDEAKTEIYANIDARFLAA